MAIIINADDFGLNESCTKAIIAAFERGLITDTTLLATGEAFDFALKEIKEKKLENKVGIHFNLTEGIPLTEEIKSCKLFVEDGRFKGGFNRLKPLSYKEKKAVYEELTAQILKIKTSGITITHADSHHHIHTGLFIAPIIERVCKEHGIKKIRIHRNIGFIPIYKKIIKSLYNMRLQLNGFITTCYFGSMEDVENVGVCDNLEIMVHPDFDKQGVLIDKVTKMDDGAVGKKLACPIGDYNLRGYKDL